MDWQGLFLSPSGRIDRGPFWIGFVLVMVASAIVNAIPGPGHLLGFLLLWPQIAVHAKRLHDMGRSAWLLLIPLVVTVVSLGAAAAVGGAAIVDFFVEGYGKHAFPFAAGGALLLAACMVGFAFLFGLGFLLWVGLSPGTPGPNRFGPAPRRSQPAPASPSG